jgi:tRNA dimethylallyltransferase
VGKSLLGIQLSKALNGEIINADSRQVYKGLDIGTAKASVREQDGVRHHLLSFLTPDEPFNLSLFIKAANTAIEDVRNRGLLPILVGGSGQYIWGLLEGWQVPEIPPNLSIRSDLELQAKRKGPKALHTFLSAVDPLVASSIDPKNERRVIRALELHFQLKGHKKTIPRRSRTDKVLIVGLTMSRKPLYQKIDTRLDSMMQNGFLDEVKGLLDSGYSNTLASMSGVGYREMAAHIRGEIPLDEAIERTKFRSHRLVRRQYSWFRHSDPRIEWLTSDGTELRKGLKLVKSFISSCDRIVGEGGLGSEIYQNGRRGQ